MRGKVLVLAQRGPVWFLGASAGTPAVHTYTCTIPAGRYVMLDPPSIDCSTLEAPPFHATTNAGLTRCAKTQWQQHQGRDSLTLDGVKLQPAGYVTRTRPFAFRMPTNNNILELPGRTRGRAAVYGEASILPPLTTDTHMLVQRAGYAHTTTSWTVTWRLTVG
jgi:hypothetical protein